MPRLEQRLQRLEQGQAERLVVVIRSFLGVIGDVVRITCRGRSTQWVREPGETAELLRQRALTDLHLVSTGGLVVLREHNSLGTNPRKPDSQEAGHGNAQGTA